jgi:hypothetical protein
MGRPGQEAQLPTHTVKSDSNDWNLEMLAGSLYCRLLTTYQGQHSASLRWITDGNYLLAVREVHL